MIWSCQVQRTAMPVTVPAPRLGWRSPRRAGPRRAVRPGSGSATATAGCASRARGQEFADPFDGPANSPPSSRGQVLATPFRGAAAGRLYCPPFAVPRVGTLSSAVISSPRPAAPWIRAAHVAGAVRLVSMSELTPLRVSLGHIPVMCASGTRFARSAPMLKLHMYGGYVQVVFRMKDVDAVRRHGGVGPGRGMPLPPHGAAHA
jgi:hypothetical protein